MSDGDRQKERPLWVQVGLWGLPSRGSALAFFWLAVAIAAGCVAYGFVDARFFVGGLMAFAALWYFASIQWMDRHVCWTTPAMATTFKAKMIAAGGIFAVLLAVYAIKTFFIGYYGIPQNGMYPGLPAGSSVFTAKRAYADAASVKRGDIVVFVREENGQPYTYIWRVVALPGEKVEASGEALTINGQPVERQRIREADGRTIFREQIGEAAYEVAFDASPASRPPDASVTIPPDQFFVMGDNRFGARDSRYFGPIAFSSIIGKKL